MVNVTTHLSLGMNTSAATKQQRISALRIVGKEMITGKDKNLDKQEPKSTPSPLYIFTHEVG